MAGLFSLIPQKALLMSLLLLVVLGHCQPVLRSPEVTLTDSDTVGYPFLNQTENRIEQEQHLRPLFQKMYEQRVYGGRRISIVHIGDSHILGDYFTRELRSRLQVAFGNAGRGLVFPYRIAGSNGPTDYLMETNCRWHSLNCQRSQEKDLPVGLTGFLLTSRAADGFLGIRLRDTATSDRQFFTKLTIFRNKTEQAFDYEIVDETTGQMAQKVVEGEHQVVYYFNRPTESATIRHRRRSPDQKENSLTGICLENELAGILYHTIGINGARYSDFTRGRHFAEQIGELFPDLIILSFGTNEASDPSLSEKVFYQQIDNMVGKLRDAAPGALFMLTTPADSYYRGKGFNPRMGMVSRVIRKYAEEHSLALWDLYKIGGGENSAAYWKSAGLMSNDSIHYSKRGYAVQGKLLYQSLVRGYNQFWLGE